MRFILAMILSIGIFIANTPKADALVGVVIRQRTVRVVGGVVAASGVGALAAGFLLASSQATAGAAIGLAFLSFPVMALGLVILDEKNADLKFSELSDEKAKKLGIAADELYAYNSEVEELNLVKEVIESQVTNKTSNEEINGLWQEYKDSLSPETLKVAALVTMEVFSTK